MITIIDPRDGTILYQGHNAARAEQAFLMLEKEMGK